METKNYCQFFGTVLDVLNGSYLELDVASFLREGSRTQQNFRRNLSELGLLEEFDRVGLQEIREQHKRDGKLMPALRSDTITAKRLLWWIAKKLDERVVVATK